jgi:N-acetylneuraminic acid mutarotase
MSKALALTLVLVFLTASTIILALPVSGTTTVENTWVEKAPMQQARGGLGVAVVNGKIYAIGGSTLSGSWPYTGGIVATNEEYDPATNTWSFKNQMPTPRTNFGITVYNNKIYCIGGEEIFKNESKAPLTNVNEVYDPTTDTWETKESMPTPRSDLRANVVNGKIYLIGGHDPNVHFKPGGSTHNEVYDPATDSWSKKEPLPDATSNYGSAVFGDRIYLIGGYAEVPWVRFDLNQIYDTKNDSWSYETPLTQDYASAACVVTTGLMAPKQIYVFGEKNVLSYNPDNDSWIPGADIPTGRGDSGVAVVNDLIYVIGGETANGLPFSADPHSLKKYATNEQYTPFGYGTLDTKEPTPTPSIPELQTWTTPFLISIMLAIAGLLAYHKKHKRSFVSRYFLLLKHFR